MNHKTKVSNFWKWVLDQKNFLSRMMFNLIKYINPVKLNDMQELYNEYKNTKTPHERESYHHRDAGAQPEREPYHHRDAGAQPKKKPRVPKVTKEQYEEAKLTLEAYTKYKFTPGKTKRQTLLNLRQVKLDTKAAGQAGEGSDVMRIFLTRQKEMIEKRRADKEIQDTEKQDYKASKMTIYLFEGKGRSNPKQNHAQEERKRADKTNTPFEMTKG